MLRRFALIAIGALVAVAAFAIGAVTADAAPSSFTVPDVHYGDTVTIATGNQNRVIVVKCDGIDGSGHHEANYNVPAGSDVITLGPFDAVTWPSGGAICIATLGDFKGNGFFRSIASDEFTIT